jgi:hypothetical protein
MIADHEEPFSICVDRAARGGARLSGSVSRFERAAAGLGNAA